jgi:cellulose biosynthesis protein BcsQ
MKITIYNLKGGVGKTHIALNLALTLDFGIITNEPFSPLEEILEESDFYKLKRTEALPEIPENANTIFDFGGYLDKRVIEALKQSHCVIIPVVNEFIDVHTTVSFIQEIEGYNKNIIIVANKTQKGDYAAIKETMKEFYPDYPVLEIKQSRAMPNIFKEKKAIKAMVESGGLKAFSYQSIEKQFSELIKKIKTFY